MFIGRTLSNLILLTLLLLLLLLSFMWLGLRDPT
jgi:hypothetical protein